MNQTITITSKGQTTIPAEIRHKLGVGKEGGVLQLTFDERKNELVISRSVNVDDLSARISSYVKPHVRPVLDVDDYYQTHRGESRG